MADDVYRKQIAIGIGVGIAVAAGITFLQNDILLGMSVGVAIAVVVVAGLAGRDIEE